MTAAGRPAGSKVAAGFVSLTEVLDGQHHSYNEWHMLDHMPEQYQLPGIVHGERWVVSPECVRLRSVAEPPFDAVHYLTLYLLAAPLQETLRDFYALGAQLRDAGRFHDDRRSHLSGPLDVTGTAVAPHALVSAATVPFRPNRGLYMVVERLGSEGSPAAPASLPVAVDGVAGVWTFASNPAIGSMSHATDAHWHLGVAFLDGDPLEVAGASGDAMCRGLSGGGEPVLAGPLLSITPCDWGWFDPQ